MLHYQVGHRLTGPDVALIQALQQLQDAASKVLTYNREFDPHRIDEMIHAPKLRDVLKRATQAISDIKVDLATTGRPQP